MPQLPCAPPVLSARSLVTARPSVTSILNRPAADVHCSQRQANICVPIGGASVGTHLLQVDDGNIFAEAPKRQACERERADRRSLRCLLLQLLPTPSPRELALVAQRRPLRLRRPARRPNQAATRGPLDTRPALRARCMSRVRAHATESAPPHGAHGPRCIGLAGGQISKSGCYRARRVKFASQYNYVHLLVFRGHLRANVTL